MVPLSLRKLLLMEGGAEERSRAKGRRGQLERRESRREEAGKHLKWKLWEAWMRSELGGVRESERGGQGVKIEGTRASTFEVTSKVERRSSCFLLLSSFVPSFKVVVLHACRENM